MGICASREQDTETTPMAYHPQPVIPMHIPNFIDSLQLLPLLDWADHKIKKLILDYVLFSWIVEESEPKIISLDAHMDAIRDISSISGNLYTLSGDGAFKKWDLRTGHSSPSLSAGFTRATAILALPNSQLAIAGSSSHMIKVIDEQAKEIRTCEGHKAMVWSLAALNNNNIELNDEDTLLDESPPLTKPHRVSVSLDHSMHAEKKLSDTHLLITSLAVSSSPDSSSPSIIRGAGEVIVSGSQDNSIRVWDSHSGKVLKVLEGHKFWITKVLCSQTYVISASLDCSVKVWDIYTGRCIRTFQADGEVFAVVALPRHRIAAAGNKGSIWIWNVKTAALEREIKAHKGEINALSLLTETILISGGADSVLHLWDLESFECVKKITIQKQIRNIITCGGDMVAVAMFDSPAVELICAKD